MLIKFGPAGLGPIKTAEDVLEQYHEKGIRACEIAFTRSIYITRKEDAIRIGKKAKELGISLSIHAPYYVNLNSAEEEKRQASKKRILDCCNIGQSLKAKTVVFHPGYYGDERSTAFNKIRQSISEMIDVLKKNRWEITISAETMGKVNVFGSMEEVSRLVNKTGCSFCIDFAHILAREKTVDFEKIKKLFPQQKWHCHFSGIVYGEKGEKHHKTTEKQEWQELLKNLPKDKDITIINESPTMLDDSIEGLKIASKIF